jgi:hypothetical protein
MILFKKQLFDLKVKGQGPTKVIMVRDTPPYSHAPTYQISLTYLERQKCYGPDKKINQTHEGFQAYEKIASTSSGQVFLLKKDQVDQVCCSIIR